MSNSSATFASLNREIMDTIIKLKSVAQFNAGRGQKTLHPLVSMLA